MSFKRLDLERLRLWLRGRRPPGGLQIAGSVEGTLAIAFVEVSDATANISAGGLGSYLDNAVEVGDRLWVGSFRGDRIAVLAAP